MAERRVAVASSTDRGILKPVAGDHTLLAADTVVCKPLDAMVVGRTIVVDVERPVDLVQHNQHQVDSHLDKAVGRMLPIDTLEDALEEAIRFEAAVRKWELIPGVHRLPLVAAVDCAEAVQLVERLD